MADFFDKDANWLDDFVCSQNLESIARETTNQWEDDVIQAVKQQHYSSLDDALRSLRERTGLTEKAMQDIRTGVMKKVALDQEWHKKFGSTSAELQLLKQAKTELVSIANELDALGEIEAATALDEALKDLP